MKGATIGHAKQRIEHGRYIGITEPGIIAAEPPNPIVNQLVIMPDIEKRLEAFVRLAHGIVVFPGGVGTAEEILYLLGILLDPANARAAAAGRADRPARERCLFRADRDASSKVRSVPRRCARFTIIIDDPAEVARHMVRGMEAVREFRREHERLLQLQLAAVDRPRVPAAVRGDARLDARARPAARPAGASRSPRTCGAPSPASSPATSRSTASRRSSARDRTSSPAIRRSCGCSMSCSPRSSRSGA